MRIKDSGVYVIAEAGVNHNGDLKLALEMIDAARSAGANAVKFQTWRTAAENVSAQTQLAGYQSENLGAMDIGQLQMLDKLGLEFDEYRALKAHCDEAGIDFISTPDDQSSIDLLVNLGVPYIKTASAELNNLPFLESVARTGVPIIMSTGMGTLDEIGAALDCIRGAGNDDVIVLHCTSEYPCPVDDVNLLAMITIREAFNVPVGYSDHTRGLEVPIAAAALGAEAIEKHFTLDRTMEGPDHAASLEPDELADMVRKIRLVERFMGDGVKRPMPSEEKNRPLMRRSLVAARAVSAGEVLTHDAVLAKRPGTGLAPAMRSEIVGRRLIRNLAEDELFSLDDFE